VEAYHNVTRAWIRGFCILNPDVPQEAMDTTSGMNAEYGGFTAEFVLDIDEDVLLNVEEFAKQVTLGSFHKARQMYDDTLAEYKYVFSIFVELLRLLLDQGDYKSLLSTAKRDSCFSSTDMMSKGWSPLQRSIVRLFFTIAKVHVHEHSQQLFLEMSSEIETAYSVIGDMELPDLDEEQV